MEENEWQQRNKARQEKLNKKIFSFVSQTDDRELKRNQRRLLLSFLMWIIVFLVALTLLFMFIAWVAEIDFSEFISVLTNKEAIQSQSQNPVFKLRIAQIVCTLIALIAMPVFFFRRTKQKYDSKTIIDLNTNTITFTEDGKEPIIIPCDEIQKWLCYNSVHHHYKADAFALKDGSVVVIDGFYRGEVHAFLESHAKELHLPDKTPTSSYYLGRFGKVKN